MRLEIEGLHADPRLQRRVDGRVAKACARLPAEPTSALVMFTDVNGPKGGMDKRCAITLWLPGKKTAHVEDTAGTEAAAFDAVIDSLERWVKDHTGKLIDARRRPKKYYLAKRLLEPNIDDRRAPVQRPGPASIRRRRRARAA